jgi:hypothetical protein
VPIGHAGESYLHGSGQSGNRAGISHKKGDI